MVWNWVRIKNTLWQCYSNSILGNPSSDTVAVPLDLKAFTVFQFKA